VHPADRIPRERRERPRRALELNRGRNLDPPCGRGWTDEQLALLGKLPDAEVARRTGRPKGAVRQKRGRLCIPKPSGPGRTGAELALLRGAPDEEGAARVGRTAGAVCQKRCLWEIPTYRDRRRKEYR
jgi:hypothetical protein